jgi:hypothetical protein
MRINSSGDVLVNTSTSAAFFDGKLRVENNGSVVSYRTSSTNAGVLLESLWHQAITGNNQFISFGTETTRVTRGNVYYDRTANGLALNGATNLVLATGETERMRITSAGRVGIGTSAPQVSLHVYSGATDEVARFEGTGTPYISLYDTNVRQLYLYASDTNVDIMVPVNKSLAFGTSNTERARIDSSGRLLVGTTTANTSGAKLQTSDGITFPATQVASSDPNTLDDYEEGTFTPTVIGTSTAGTATYAIQFGNYTKIGRLVTVSIFLSWSAGTGTGNLRFAGLPFSTLTTANSYYSVAIGYVDQIALTADNYIIGYTLTNSSQIEFAQTPVGGGAKTDLPYDSSGSLIVTCSYFTAT